MEGEAGDVARAERVLDQLAGLMRGGYKLAKGDVRTASQLVAQDDSVELSDYFLRGTTRTPGKRQVTPKSVNQRRYLEAIDKFDIVFGIGPAGTGKTYLAMAQAVSFLLAKRVSRIILARPAVEAGEKLGFLPGDLQEKVNPYLRPLYDALYDMVVVGLGRQDDTDVLHCESERADILQHGVRVLFDAGVDQHMTVRRRDEEGRKVESADVVDVRHHPVRLRPFSPARRNRPALRRARSRKRCRRKGGQPPRRGA